MEMTTEDCEAMFRSALRLVGKKHLGDCLRAIVNVSSWANDHGLISDSEFVAELKNAIAATENINSDMTVPWEIEPMGRMKNAVNQSEAN